MSLRRPAAPRRCPTAPDALLRAAAPRPAGFPLALCLGFLALTAASPTRAAAPLPPAKPKDLKAPTAPVVAPLPSLRAAPLPPRRPPELAEEEAEAEPGGQEAQGEEAGQREGPVDVGTAERFVREPTTPGGRPRVASRETSPDAVPSPGGPGLLTPSAPSPGPAAPLVMPSACADLVAAGEIEADLDVSLSINPACGLFVPVRLTAVRLGDGRMIPLRPAAVSRCEMTVAAAAWMRESLAPAVAAAGGALAAIRIADSYNCRPRNRVAGAKMSEHGRGNAVDVGGFELGDGRAWSVAKGGLPMALRVSMKDSACTRFATVLGPGSDGYHEDHIHVDLAQRRNDFKLCHWNLDAGTAVASRKDKPAPSAPAASAQGEGGDAHDGEAAGPDKDSADKNAAAASAGNAAGETDGGPAPAAPPKGNAAGGTSRSGKASPPKDGSSKDGSSKDGSSKRGQAKSGQAGNAQPKNAQNKDGGTKPTPSKQTQPD